MECPIRRESSGLWECPWCHKRLAANDIIGLSTWWGDEYAKCLKCGNEKPAREFKKITE